MANAMPWSVRGIDPDIREQAVEAAHRSGMSVGQWLNQVLAGNLDEDEEVVPVASPRNRRGGRVDTLANRLERLGRPRLQTAAHRLTERDNDNAPVLDLIESAVQAIERLEEDSASRRGAQRGGNAGALEERLAGLLDALEQQRAAPAPAQSRVSSMGRRPGQQQQGFGRSQRQFEDDPAFSQAIAEIEARRRDLDLAQGVNSAQGAAGARVAAPVMRASGDESRHLDGMRQQLDLLLSRIDDMRAQPKPDTGRIHDRLDQIANKVEDISRQPKPDTSRIHDHLEQLAGRIEDMRREPRPDTLRLQDRIENIATRMDEWRARPSEDVALVRRDLASLAATIESLSPDRLVGMVEGAVARIAEKSYRAHQQESLPDGVVHALGAMQDDIRATLREIADAQNSDRVAHEVGIVARRLDQIGQVAPDLSRVDDILQETASIKTLIGQAMHAQPLEALTHQLEALARQIERAQSAPQGFDDRALIEAITSIRDRVDRIDPAVTFSGIETRLEAISAIEAKLGAISGIEAKLGELAQDMSKIDGIARDVSKLDDIARDVSKLAKEAQPFPQLESIAARLERIDRVLDHNREQPLAGLDRLADKLDKIGVSLDKVAAQPQPVQHDTLVDMLDQLSKRMDQAQSAPADTAALDALQEDIARLTARIEQTPANVLGLEGLERSVTDLFGQLDITRREIREASENTAQQAAREAVKTVVRDESTDTLAAEGLLLLKRDLGEFKSAQNDADKRTRQMLENLHSTLEALGTRLAQLDAPRPAPIAAAPAMAAPVVSQPAPAPVSQPQRMPEERAQSGAAMAASFRETMTSAPAAAKPMQPTPAAAQQDEFSDLPLEPGQRPGMRQDAAASSDPMMTSDPRSNFIAAARRAAQAAAERSQAALDEEEQTAKKSKLSLKNLLSRKGGKVSKADIPAKANAARDLLKSGTQQIEDEGEKPQSFLARQRRPILLGLAALVFALGALKVLTSRNGGANLDMVPPMPQMERSLPTPPPAEQRGEAPVEQKAPEVQERADGPSVPAISPNKSGPAIPPPGGAVQAPVGIPTIGDGKRAQRLQDASALSQADPITVGSIAADGSARPIETGRGAILDLVGQANLKGQDKLREAALSGNAAALFEMGARYADGKGVNRDPKLAMRWFEQSAATGHAPSQYRLASLYREGKGVPKDASLAFQWFDRAAAQGHVLAMHNAAVLLAEGVHGTPDYAGAALWFKRAAEHGVKDSQFNVAILFARGLGVAQDMNESFRWFSAAAAQGDQDAAKKRDDIAARMSKDQLAKEREKLKNFVPMKANPAANEPGSWEQNAAKVKTSRG